MRKLGILLLITHNVPKVLHSLNVALHAVPVFRLPLGRSTGEVIAAWRSPESVMWWVQDGAVAPGHFVLTGEVDPEAGVSGAASHQLNDPLGSRERSGNLWGCFLSHQVMVYSWIRNTCRENEINSASQSSHRLGAELSMRSMMKPPY